MCAYHYSTLHDILRPSLVSAPSFEEQYEHALQDLMQLVRDLSPGERLAVTRSPEGHRTIFEVQIDGTD